MDETTTTTEKLSQELRRGSLVLAVLSQLRDPKYGYALIDDLGRHGLAIEQGTLYPLLRRLEEQGLLRSEWNVDGSRPRRYYVLSAQGDRVLRALTDDWLELTQALVGLLPK
jgi:PadR family transcriptional regulator, regulatory protein PadR